MCPVLSHCFYTCLSLIITHVIPYYHPFPLCQVKEYREEVGSMATCHIITRMSKQAFCLLSFRCRRSTRSGFAAPPGFLSVFVSSMEGLELHTPPHQTSQRPLEMYVFFFVFFYIFHVNVYYCNIWVVRMSIMIEMLLQQGLFLSILTKHLMVSYLMFAKYLVMSLTLNSLYFTM